METVLKIRSIRLKKSNEQERKAWRTAAWDMLYLITCSINSAVPEYKRVAEMDFHKVYSLSKSQSLEAMTYMALEGLLKVNDAVRKHDPEQILEQWEESKNKAIRKTMLMNAERGRLSAYLEEQKIWYLPLKGIVLCPLYPAFGMRQMSDNDILFDASYRQEVRSWFESQGYTVESYGWGNDDAYHKKPVYNFEMHTALFHEDASEKFSSYYLSLKNRLLPAADRKFEYVMSDEDFYIYMVAHIYKHYSNNGTGLRSLLDMYIYNRAKNNLNCEYIKEELTKTDLCEFEKEMRALALKIFNPQFEYSSLTQKEQKMLYNLISNHTYGRQENGWRKQVKETQPDGAEITAAVKIRYFLARLFPKKEYMEKWCEMYAPFFFRNRWLMLLAYIWRIIKVGNKNRKRIKKEFETVRKM